MTQTNVHLTNVHSNKLRSIVGQGSTSPYQIWVTPGRSLGVIGKIIEPSEIIASNDPVLSGKSWLLRVLTALGRKKT